jgi:heptaprenylglyceryl phosphate synthase
MMKNNTNLKNLILNNVLTESEMMLVKGGVNVNTSANGLAKANSIVTGTSDDKRRERPGGGITTH